MDGSGGSRSPDASPPPTKKGETQFCFFRGAVLVSRSELLLLLSFQKLVNESKDAKAPDFSSDTRDGRAGLL